MIAYCLLDFPILSKWSVRKAISAATGSSGGSASTTAVMHARAVKKASVIATGCGRENTNSLTPRAGENSETARDVGRIGGSVDPSGTAIAQSL